MTWPRHSRWLVLVALLVAALVPFACSDDGPGEGEARLEVEGRAEVRRVDGDVETITDSTTLHTGDRVELVDGTGRMELPSDVELELREARGDAPNTALTLRDTPALEAGDLLVVAEDVARVSAAGTLATVDSGAARVSRHLAVSLAAYEGAVAVDSAGVARTVPALRQLSIPVLGRPERDVLPLRYDAADPWDRRFLGEAISLGERLERLARGYTSSLPPGQGRTVGFFQIVLPGLEEQQAFTPELLEPPRPPGEVLVGAAIADLGVSGTFLDRWNEVFDFRDDGAAWGLVALDQQVSSAPLVGAIEYAFGASEFDFAAPTTTSPTVPPSTAPPSTSPPTSGQPTTSTTDGTTTTTEPDSPIGPIEPVTDPVEDLLDSLVGTTGNEGLLGIGGG